MEKKSLQDIEKKLLSDLRTILGALYPNGRVEGAEFVLGNVQGEAGKSLKINLRTGLWADFSRDEKGRILKFFSYRNGGSFPKGMDEVRQLLKLPPSLTSNKFKRPKKDWLDDTDFDSKPLKYLMQERKLTRSILSACKVRSNDTEYIFTGHDEENKLSYAQYVKRLPSGEKEIRFSPKSKLCLWGMHSMPSLNTSGSVVITEGVLDAITFRMMDVFAVSIPSGISNTDWITHSWNWLSQFDKIYLCFDWDEAGQEKIQEIAGRLGIYRCQKVIVPDKDANQTLINHPADWIQLLKKYIASASNFTPDKRVTARDVRSIVDQAILDGPLMNQGDLILGWEFKPTPNRKVPLNFRFRPGEQTIWTGYTGGGKSAVLFQHAAYAMYVLGQTVAIASLEEPVQKVITTIITIALGYFPEVGTEEYEKAYEVINEKLIIFNELGIASLDEVLDFFEYASKKDGAKHCILDSLMCTDLNVDGDKEAVNQMLKKIIQSINRVGSHYHIVAHAVKGDDESYEHIPTVSSVKGIQEITARAHNTIIVWRNKAKENSMEGAYAKGLPHEAEQKKMSKGDTIIKIAKNRNGKQLGQYQAWFDIYSSRFRPEFDERCDRPYFENTDSHTD